MYCDEKTDSRFFRTAAYSVEDDFLVIDIHFFLVCLLYVGSIYGVKKLDVEARDGFNSKKHGAIAGLFFGKRRSFKRKRNFEKSIIRQTGQSEGSIYSYFE